MLVNIIFSLCAFVVIIVIFYLMNLRKLNLLLNKKIQKNKKIKKEVFIAEVKYLNIRYNLQVNNMLNKKFIFLISAIDSFIISLTFFVISLIKWKIMWQLLIGFVVIFGLIYSIYEILGKILVKRGFDK